VAMTPDHWLWVIGLLLSAFISWIVSRYYYRRSEKKRTPTFIVQSVNTLVDSNFLKRGGFSVLWERRYGAGPDLAVGDEGISEATIYFWNSGNLPILADEVLEPYRITIKNVPILGYSVVKSSRDVVGMKLSYLGEDGDGLELGFSVLEPGDGVTIRLIFDGPPTSKIVFSGASLECRKPKILPPNPIYSVPIGKRFRDTYLGILLFALVAGAGAGLLAALAWVTKRLFGERVQTTFFIGLLCLVGLVMVSAVLVSLWEHFKRMTSPYLPPDIKE
jgi:hypothetical protein